MAPLGPLETPVPHCEELFIKDELIHGCSETEYSAWRVYRHVEVRMFTRVNTSGAFLSVSHFEKEATFICRYVLREKIDSTWLQPVRFSEAINA